MNPTQEEKGIQAFFIFQYTFSVSHYLYIARCSDGSLYTGTCVDLANREAKHNQGSGAKYTRSRLPVRFVYHEIYSTLIEARQRESAVKKLTKDEKEFLVRHHENSY